MPTWTNPSPNGWGADMPAQIGPGPSNPLGVRALNWSTMDGGATAIRFHGTRAVSQLGQGRLPRLRAAVQPARRPTC